MSLSNLAAIGSFLSGIAIVASLVYLAIQIRQASRNQRGTMHQMRAQLSTDIMMRVAEAGLANSFRAGLSGASDISESQFWQFYYAASAILRTTENAYMQHQDGLVSGTHFESARASALSFLASPGYRALWLATGRSREPGFRHFMDKLLAEAEERPAQDLFQVWKSQLAVKSQT